MVSCLSNVSQNRGILKAVEQALSKNPQKGCERKNKRPLENRQETQNAESRLPTM